MSSKVTVSVDAVLGAFDQCDQATEEYVQAYADAVAEAIRRTYPGEEVQVRVSWSAPHIAVEAGEGIDPESVLAIANDLWNNPSSWFRKG